MSSAPGDEDAGADDVVEPGACLGQRRPDDPRQMRACSYGVGGRVGVPRHDRRRPGDPDLAPDAYGPGVADAVLEGGAGGDPLAIHAGSVVVVEALRQVNGWPCEHAAVAVVGRGGVEASHGDLERPFAGPR